MYAPLAGAAIGDEELQRALGELPIGFVQFLRSNLPARWSAKVGLALALPHERRSLMTESTKPIASCDRTGG